MRRAHSSQPARNDLAAFGNEAGEQAHVLVVDGVDFLHAELANFLAAEEFASALARALAAGATTRVATRPAILPVLSSRRGGWCRCICHVSPSIAARGWLLASCWFAKRLASRK